MSLVLFCGSRDWTDLAAIGQRVGALPTGTVVMTGGARGADAHARAAAVVRGLFVAEIQVDSRHWDRYGNRAGLLRNDAMLSLNPELVVAFQCHGSRGTQYTIDAARRRGITVEVHDERTT